MCKFFSLVSNGDGKPLYFDAKKRKQIVKKELKYDIDNHTSIADHFGFNGEKEDVLNKYEYNPITRVFGIDQLNNPVNDSEEIKAFCEKLDFKTIAPELIIHPIVHPFKDFKVSKVSKKDIALLKQWASVRASVEDSVWDSVWDSVGASVWDSVRASVGASVWASARDLVGDSVWASVWADASSYFNIPKWKYIEHKQGINPYQPCIDLWNKGLVPSFDGKVWRLHGHEGKIVFEIEKEKLSHD